MGKNLEAYELIWQKVLQNDMQAFEKIYKHYYPSLFNYAEKLTKESNMAEDAIHDTFLYLWKHRSQIGEIRSIQFYLFRSIRNSCLKLIQRKSKLSSLEEVKTRLELTILPEELYLKDSNLETKKLIQKALLELSSRQREIIFLKFFNNLDYNEIGEILDINYQSVVNHVHRAIQKLRKSKILQLFRH